MSESSYIIACCHPPGESKDYVGLFYRDCEFDELAKQLVDKPLLFNHEESVPLGKVVSAWTESPTPGSAQPRQVFALCEIDDSTMNGALAKRGIDREVLQDVSIGHTCKIDYSSDVRTVAAKDITELSICERGAREKTHIYGVSWGKRTESSTPGKEGTEGTTGTTYIKVGASSALGKKKETTSQQK